MNDYAVCPVKPKINITDSSFMLTLPNIRVNLMESHIIGNGQESRVMELIERDGYLTSATLAEAMKLGKTRCYVILKEMAAAGKVKEVRNGRRIEYHKF